ncbi:unnamed protein product [Adineta steineri]|uniref:Uncharacterized protein n=1 Tax=Adineta steineri TaxID=433720 RepID=A0A818P283_9BILA|nr:unnamed protein product [Adineta steineri]CAF1480555.1 unnamed protein product [Adineta steineri]CAF3613950.1 unnamed protein product [Adineta steineri]CAF3954548.1 unnamed protein product [Adineta steineri]
MKRSYNRDEMNYNFNVHRQEKRQLLTTPPHSNEPVETNYERSDDSSNISTQIYAGTSDMIYPNQESSTTDNNCFNLNEQHDDDEHNQQQTLPEEESHESNFGNNTNHSSNAIDNMEQDSDEELENGLQPDTPTSSAVTEPGESDWDIVQATFNHNSIVHKTGQNGLSNIPQGSDNSSTAPNEPSLQKLDVVPPTNGHRLQNYTNRDGYIAVPVVPEGRFRPLSDLSGTKKVKTTSKITFMLNKLNLVCGPSWAFRDGYVELTLLARTNDGRYILSPHKFFDPAMDPDNVLSNPKYVKIDSYNDNDVVIKENLVIVLSRQNDFIDASLSESPIDMSKNPKFKIIPYPSGIPQVITGLKPRQMFDQYNLYDMYLGIRPASPSPNGGFSVEPDAPIIYSNCFSHVGQKKINLNDEQYKFQISNIITNVTDSPYPSTLQWSITCDVKVPEMYHCALTSGYLWLEMKIKKLTRASLTLLSADWSTPDKIYFNIDNKAHKFSFNIIVSDQNSADVPVNNENPLFSLHLTMCHVEKGTNIRNVFENSITKLNGAYSENRLELSMAN